MRLKAFSRTILPQFNKSSTKFPIFIGRIYPLPKLFVYMTSTGKVSLKEKSVLAVVEAHPYLFLKMVSGKS